MDPIIAVIIAVAAFIVGAAAAGFICFKMGVKHRIKTAEAQFESAEKESARIIEEANVNADSARHQLSLDIVVLDKPNLIQRAQQVDIESRDTQAYQHEYPVDMLKVVPEPF